MSSDRASSTEGIVDVFAPGTATATATSSTRAPLVDFGDTEIEVADNDNDGDEFVDGDGGYGDGTIFRLSRRRFFIFFARLRLFSLRVIMTGDIHTPSFPPFATSITGELMGVMIVVCKKRTYCRVRVSYFGTHIQNTI